ncbi:hypothetical protein C7T94_17930 [Pedobacter yulinensis]|uniref:Uncharacterized protein n=1 Tax=Pedobacter yulinensis TaxID=2126353 RepID=A0A2T3HH39_9SPHI|nr:hypothetical protein [Pedobacter yulinensis]PST81750.1 hypothetical protein C7T94_17930 [Pedobacter yulinensis]
MRISPFNVLAAAVVVFAGWSLFSGGGVEFSIWRALLLIVLLFIFFVVDLVFRQRLRSSKRLWIIEITLIILAVIFILIFNAGW